MKSLLAMLGTVAACAAAWAQEGEEPAQPALEEEILVVAKRRESEAALATPAVTRFDREDLERRQSSLVSDVLQEAPGAYVAPDGTSGQFTRVFLRGAASNQTLVVVDGVPQNDATTGGGFDFGDLTADGVERVEVLRGSYGLLYGSEAIGGVVSVTTRRGRGPVSGFLRAWAGSFDTHGERAGAQGGNDEGDFAVALGSLRTQGDRDRESFRAYDAVGRFGLALTEHVRLDAALRGVVSRVESPFDFATSGVLPEDRNIERRREALAPGVTVTADATDRLQFRAAGSLLRLDSDFSNGPDGPTVIDPDFTPGTGDEFTVVQDELRARNGETDLRGRLEATAALSGAIELTAGGEVLRQASISESTFPDFNAPTSTTTRIDETTYTRSVFAQGEARLPDVEPWTRAAVVTLGSRYDRHSVFGSETSPFVGARVDLAPTDTTLRAARGEGFRAPKPAELDDPFVGNRDLGPEVSRSFDLGAEQRFLGGALAVGATWFRLRTDGLIAYDATDTTPSRPFGRLVNFARTETRGFEYTAVADLGAGFRARAACTTQSPRDLDTGLPLPNRPRHFGSAGLSWESGPMVVSLDGFFSGATPHQGGEFTAPDREARERPGRRRVVNLTARWRATGAVTLFARVENLLDDEWVATPSSPAGPGIGFFLGAQVDF